MERRSTIQRVRAIQLLDSRGRPTVGVEVQLADGTVARASAPSGASTGQAEAMELRDGDVGAYGGYGVRMAVTNVNLRLAPPLVGLDATNQTAVDTRMAQIDGTVNWSAVGANAAVAVSMAVCRAAAAARRIPLYRHIADLCHVTQPALPMPMVNILSGGLHARLAMDLQDFLIVPVGATDYDQALEWIWRVRTAASTVAERRGLSTLLADEGGISPGCASVVEGFSLMDEIIACSGLEPGGQVAVAIDVAANGLLRTDGAYHFAREGVVRDASAITALLNDCVRRFPVCSIEDPLADEDWAGWSALSAGLVDVQLVGDDLLSTQPARIARAAAAGIANAALIKINQNGSLSGTLEAMRVTRDAGYRTIVSARSGETEDDFIADLAVGTAAGQIKIGSMRCSERQSKYNRLAWITADDDRLPLTNPFAKRTPDPRDVRRDARGARRKEL